MKITNDVFAACLKCKYKAWKILKGEQGIPHAYGQMMAQLQKEYKVCATNALLKKLKLFSAPPSCKLTELLISEGHPLILDTILEYGQFYVHFDALQRVDGRSSLGNVLYEPVLFHTARKIHRDDKLCLALAGYVLSIVQGVYPPKGRIIFGENCSATTVQLINLNRKMLGFVHILLRMIRNESKPKIFLNQHCNICSFRNRCQKESIETDTLSRLRGITEREIERQNNKGIFTVEQYSYTYRPRKRRTNVKNQIRKHHLALNALAIRTDTIYIEQVPELPIAKNHIYLDIEGLPDRDFYYLISAIVHQGGKQEEYTLWADNKSCEQDLWLSFANLTNGLEDFVIFHYGNYDLRSLIQLCRRYDSGQAFEELLLATAYNVLSAIYGHIYFPCYANDLKSVASCLGFRWHDPDSSGIKSIIERLSWERSACKKSRDCLIRYNKDDCEALRCVTNAIYALSQNRQTDDFRLSKTVVHTDTMKEPHAHELIDHRAFFPELEIINRRSYFDYQRNRVYVRTNHDYKRRVRQVLARKQSRQQVDKKITLETPTHCPYCKAMSFHRHSLLETIVEDLKFNSKGVKRWNIKYKSSRYRCNKCRKVFAPKRFRTYSATKHGHNLMAWSVYHHIESRQSGVTIVESLKELFGHDFDRKLPHRLKRRAAAFYIATYQSLKDKIRSARVVYADETPMPIKEGRGYVWAFTTLEEVFYVYSDTREGGVVSRLLEGFDGVLVSDFYAAYDSLPCRQQKCLIHLIRDLNDDLFKNPFDEELKELTRGLTRVLVPIVTAIDRFGFKKRHLGKFRKHADEFVSSVTKQPLTSEVAKGYQQRITKYHDKLFEFLKHDGVAWSNNNAEHAIKRFAMLRQIIGNTSTGNGVQDYLILLSICETLRRRHLSFLRFLLSQSVDLDQFAKKR